MNDQAHVSPFSILLFVPPASEPKSSIFPIYFYIKKGNVKHCGKLTSQTVLFFSFGF